MTNDKNNSSLAAFKHKFGTFGGVFTPAILTILGVIMFMRANFVVGEAGIIGAVIILTIAKSITFSTSLSIAAVSTNLQMRGGGSYFLISRVMGPEFGGAIGITLFCALALSVPFYILGFTEALVRSNSFFAPYFQVITLSTALLLFGVAYYGAGLAIKTQYLIMAILFAAIAVFMLGGLQHFSTATFLTNLHPAYTPVADKGGNLFSFWLIFAIYFPAVTGIDAGVNMSGDLNDPGHSLPRGTMAAVGLGFVIYLMQIIIGGGAWDRSAMIATPFELLRDNALFGWGWLVVAGVIAATISSALSSYLGAPRVLQAVSRDRILKSLNFFARGTARGDEPRRAMAFTLIITILVLIWAGNEAGGAALNAIAAIITMFFLYSYGMINLAAFIEDFGDNPSFRPEFKYFHWGISLFGAAGCLVVAILISWLAAIAAVLVILALLWHIKTKHLKTTFGDARRGFIFQSVRKNLFRLNAMADDPKNWRPALIAFSGNPKNREILVTYAAWIAAKRGIVSLASILVGEFTDLAVKRPAAIDSLKRYCQENQIEAFPLVVAADSLEQGTSMLLQTASTGPIHANVIMIGWTTEYDRVPSYLRQLAIVETLSMSAILLHGEILPAPDAKKRIDIWWRGMKNGSLMLLIAYLITENWEWEKSRIRLMRVVEKEEAQEPAAAALTEMIKKARIPATAEVIVSTEQFSSIIVDHSGDADCVILGFELPEPGAERSWHGFYQTLLPKLPTTILVKSNGRENIAV